MEVLKNVKTALFIENEIFEDMKGHNIYHLYEFLSEMGVDCKVIDRAASHKIEVFTYANKVDLIAFASTFLYANDVKGVGDLLKMVKEPKLIFGQSISSGSIVSNIESIWSLEELVQLSHHRLFEITSSPKYFEDIPDWLTEIDMTVYQKEVDRLEKERIERNKGFQKTGRTVKIKKINAVGSEWSDLKEGDIVDELNCLSIDPNPSRGVWVMGKTEPVKLLNDSGYEEWEYAELNATGLAREFFSRGSSLDKTDLLNLVADWIKNVSGRLNETDLWVWCDNLCNTVGVERRGNRSYFDRRLKEYRGKYTYFKER